MKKLFRNGWGKVLVLAVVAMATSKSHGDTIAYVGEISNAGANVAVNYGTGGYDLYSTTTPTGNNSQIAGTSAFNAGTRLTDLPSYLSSITAAVSGFPHVSYAGAEYATINNPAGGSVESGVTHTYSSTPGAQLDLLTINVSQNEPDFYIGFITNLDSTASDYPDQLRLRQTAGTGGGDSGLTNTTVLANGGFDLYVFKVTGANAGDSLTFSGTQTVVNPTAPVYVVDSAGLTFSQSDPIAAPLPSAGLAGMMLLGGFATWKMRYRLA